MEKEFIPYEEALALKELSFNETCFKYYNPSYSANNDVNELSFFPNEHVNCVKAPLYQQAFRWFREKYGFTAWIEGKVSFKFCIESENPTDDQLNQFPFKSYDDAQITCLRKLIEIANK